MAEKVGDDKKDLFVNKTETKPKKPSKLRKITLEAIDRYAETMPDRIREYLNKRGITDTIISAYKLGYGKLPGQGGNWITIPITDINGEPRFFKLRRDPEINIGPKMIAYPSGSGIYGVEHLKELSEVFYCGGEFDRLVLEKNGIQAITSTVGENGLPTGSIDLFNKLDKIYICLDNDKTGYDATRNLIDKLSVYEDLTIYKIEWPEGFPEKGDVTDYFTTYGGTMDLFLKLFKKVNSQAFLRVRALEDPKKVVKFVDWQDTVKNNFPSLAFASELCLSVCTQILITNITNPFSLVLVDDPASGKTIILNFFSEIEDLTYASDKFTPASFVSNSANVKKEELEDIDLLPRLRYKTFIIRDLATLFSKKEDDLTELLGILTRVLDGEGLNTDTGVHGSRQYVGEYLFMLLAASTPIKPKVWNIMGSLGARLFFLNLNTDNKSEEELLSQLGNNTYKDKEKKCRNATKNFLLGMWKQYPNGIEWNNDGDPDEVKKIIIKCGMLLANLRGVVTTWKERDENGHNETAFAPPVIEKPDRVDQLLYNLCKGHALSAGREQINRDDLRFIVDLSIDSCPDVRSRILRLLIENDGLVNTGMIEQGLNVSNYLAIKEMEKMEILGVCDVKKIYGDGQGRKSWDLTLKKNFEWFLSEEFKELSHKS